MVVRKFVLETSSAARGITYNWEDSSFFSYVTAALYSASSLRTHLYHFVSEPKNWTDAQSYCRETHTHLVAIETMEDMDILKGMADLNKTAT